MCELSEENGEVVCCVAMQALKRGWHKENCVHEDTALWSSSEDDDDDDDGQPTQHNPPTSQPSSAPDDSRPPKFSQTKCSSTANSNVAEHVKTRMDEVGWLASSAYVLEAWDDWHDLISKQQADVTLQKEYEHVVTVDQAVCSLLNVAHNITSFHDSSSGRRLRFSSRVKKGWWDLLPPKWPQSQHKTNRWNSHLEKQSMREMALKAVEMKLGTHKGVFEEVDSKPVPLKTLREVFKIGNV